MYPDGAEDIWTFMCSRKTRIMVDIDIMPLDGIPRGDYFNDEAFRGRFQQWLNALWSRKDGKIHVMLGSATAAGNRQDSSMRSSP